MSKISQDLQISGHNEEGRNVPWILVVEAKCNLIDSMGVGHDQVEAILQRKGEERPLMVGKGKPAGPPIANLPQAGAQLSWFNTGGRRSSEHHPLPDSS